MRRKPGRPTTKAVSNASSLIAMHGRRLHWLRFLMGFVRVGSQTIRRNQDTVLNFLLDEGESVTILHYTIDNRT